VAAQILPTAAGLLLGVVNMFGSVAGALAPYIMARLTEYPEGTSREQWEQLGSEPSPTWLLAVKEGWASVFILAFWMDILGIVVYGTFSSGERQPWSPRTTSLAAQRSEGGGQDAGE
jgi:membrane protein YqaA with SNARE-associated domain